MDSSSNGNPPRKRKSEIETENFLKKWKQREQEQIDFLHKLDMAMASREPGSTPPTEPRPSTSSADLNESHVRNANGEPESEMIIVEDEIPDCDYDYNCDDLPYCLDDDDNNVVPLNPFDDIVDDDLRSVEMNESERIMITLLKQARFNRTNAEVEQDVIDMNDFGFVSSHGRPVKPFSCTSWKTLTKKVPNEFKWQSIFIQSAAIWLAQCLTRMSKRLALSGTNLVR